MHVLCYILCLFSIVNWGYSCGFVSYGSFDDLGIMLVKHKNLELFYKFFSVDCILAWPYCNEVLTRLTYYALGSVLSLLGLDFELHRRV